MARGKRPADAGAGGLFAPAPDATAPAATPPAAGEEGKSDEQQRRQQFREASARWARLYERAERRPYAWRGRCNRHLADVLAECGGMADAFEAVAVAYLADRWQGYDGHELRHLARDVARFVTRARSAAAGGGAGIGAARRAGGSRSDAIL